MNGMNETKVGKIGTHLVCVDLLLKGYEAFIVDEGLSFDVVLNIGNKLLKIQVKTTRKPQSVPQRKIRTDKYIFHIRRCGRGGRRSYLANEVDIFAIVALDTKSIGYLRVDKARQTMFFLPEDGNVVKKCNIKKISEYGLEKCLK